MHIFQSKTKLLLVPLISLTSIPFTIVSCGNITPPFIPSPTAYVGNTKGTDWKGYKSGELEIELEYYVEEKTTSSELYKEWDGYGEALIENGTSLDDNPYCAENLIIPDFVQDENGLLYKVVSIGKDDDDEELGFSNTSLKGEVILPHYLNNICAEGFYNCDEITSIIVNENLVDIKPEAFTGCDGLFSETFGEKNKISHDEKNIYYLVGGEDKYYCLGKPENVGLETAIIPGTKITINEKTKAICKDAFFQLDADTTIEPTVELEIGNHVEYINDGAFANCTYLKGGLTIPDSVRIIGNFSFSNCFGFTGTLKIGKNVEKLNQKCFALANPDTTFTSLEIKTTNLKFIWADVFQGETGIISDTFGEKNKISHDATNVYYLVDDNDKYYCLGEPRNVVINPQIVIDYAAVAIDDKTKIIGAYAFAGGLFTTAVTIPDNVVYICEAAFAGCAGITALILGNNVTHIGPVAFYSCGNIVSLVMGNKVKYIGDSAFSYCSKLKEELNIPNSVTHIGNAAFAICTIWQGALTIGNKVEYIGVFAFADCTNKKGNLVIPNNVKYIGDGAFSNCYSLNGLITIGNHVKYIGNGAFGGCNEIGGTLNIPDSVENIGSHAFTNCAKLEEINIGSGLKTIRQGAFYECGSITETLTIPSTVKKIEDNAFGKCTGISEVVLDEQIEYLDSKAFFGCGNLISAVAGVDKKIFKEDTNIYYLRNGDDYYCLGSSYSIKGGDFEAINNLTLNEKTKLIAAQAFWSLNDTELSSTNLTIPNNVETINYGAFMDLPGLIGILTIPSNVKNTDNWAFRKCTGITKIDFNSWNALPVWNGEEIFSWFGAIGQVVSTDGTMSSEQLLAYAKEKGLGNEWTVPSA